MANVWVYTQRDVTSGRKSAPPEKMMDVLTKRAPRATWAHVAVGGALCSWPITSAEAPHPLPPLTPDAPLQPPFPSKYFQGNRPKMEASSSHAPILANGVALRGLG